jgi:hypothetical protein
MDLHSASTKAVLPEPTGPPTPIRKACLVVINTPVAFVNSSFRVHIVLGDICSDHRNAPLYKLVFFLRDLRDLRVLRGEIHTGGLILCEELHNPDFKI